MKRVNFRPIRRALCLLLCLGVLFAAAPPARAGTAGSLSLSTGSVSQGGSVTLRLRAEQLTGLGALDLYLRYDSENLSYTSHTKTGLGTGDGTLLLCSETEAGLLHLTMACASGILGTGELAQITFTARDGAACQDYPVELIVSEALDPEGASLALGASSGTIQVSARQVPLVRFSSQLSASQVKTGETVTFSASASNTQNMAGGIFRFYYDDAVLTLEDITPGDSLDGIYCDYDKDKSGYASVTCLATSAIPAGTFLTLYFTANKPGTAQIRCIPQGLIDADMNSLESAELTAQVTVTQPDPPVVLPTLALSCTQEHIRSGDGVDLTLTLSKNSGIAALVLNVNYDQAVLQYTGSNALSSESGIAMVNDGTDGTVRLVYAGGVLPAETVLLTLHFRANMEKPVETAVTLAVESTLAEDGTALQTESAGKTLAIHAVKVLPAVPATCSATGLTEGAECDPCGAVITAQQVVPKLPHTEVIDAAKAPTCTETGLTEGKHCSVCGEVLAAQKVVPANGHTEVIDAAKAPTCTETGLTEGKHCSVCGAVLAAQKVVPANGHTEVIDAAKAPTCTAAGLTEGKHCSVCGAVLTAQQSVPALGHDWGAWTQTLAPGYETPGQESRSCSRCKEAETRVIPSLLDQLLFLEIRKISDNEWEMDVPAGVRVLLGSYLSTGQQQSVRELSDGSAAGTLRFSLPDDSASAKFFFLRMDYGPLCCKAVGE